MSNFDDDTDTDDSGVFSVDPEDQEGAEGDGLDERGLLDPQDEGYSPPERSRGVEAFGTTFEEARQGESLEQRLAQEVPDPAAAFDDPLAQDADPDQVDPADEWLDDGEVGDLRAGRLVAPDEGVREDTESELLGDDVGIDGANASAEEAAVHVVPDDEV